MPSARVRGTVLAGIAGLALSAMFGFAPAASADTGSSPAPLGLLGTTVGSTLGVVSSTLNGLTGSLAPPADRGAAHVAAASSSHHVKHATHRAHRAAHHPARSTGPAHRGRSGHAWTGHGQAHRATQHHSAGARHGLLAPAQRHNARPADVRGAAHGHAKLTAFQSTPTPQNQGLLGGLLGGLTSLVNGTISGVTGLVGDTTHGLGQLLGGGQSSSAPPPHSPPPTAPGGGSSTPSAPGSSTPPSAPHQPPATAGGTPAGSTPATHPHRTLGRALPAPADVPSLISTPSRTVVPTTRPQPTPASTPIAGRVVPVSLTSAPSGWVLFAAVGLFTIAVVFMVLGAGYRGRRAR
jgi:hypothetical protein